MNMSAASNRFALLGLIVALSMVGVAAGAPEESGASIPEEWKTWAELHDFRSTPSYDETIRFLEKIENELPAMKLTWFGESGQGRPMPLVIVSSDQAFTPEEAAATGKPIVLIQNGIHAGEIDGKDACIMILRDMALGTGAEILDNVILLIIPLYNVDGHERVSPHWRPAQDGPVEGMGFRANAAGLDLNRDHLKLDSMEARNVIGLFNRWRPHLHIDNHVTNGAHHDWVLTYAFVERPQTTEVLTMRIKALMKQVVKETRKRGFPIGPYVDLLDYSDPSKGFSSYVGRPWYATGYYPLRNVPSILVENHAPKPYKDRVLANQAFLEEILRYVHQHPDAIRNIQEESGAWTRHLGKPATMKSDIVLSWKRDEEGAVTIRYPGRDWAIETSQVTGKPILLYDDATPRPMEVPWVFRSRPDKTAPRPLGYLIQPGWPVVEERLRRHNLQFTHLTGAVELDVDTLRVSNPRNGPRTYQGHNRVTYDVETRRETRLLPAGTLWIPAAQADFELAVQLLEPDSPDSLASWGMLTSPLEWKEYISGPVLEPKVRKMLEDPELRAEWEEVLKDEEFAADGNARFMWWYTRSPHWDEQVGMLPIMRLPRVEASEPVEMNKAILDMLPVAPLPGRWQAWLDSPGGELPFGLEILQVDGGIEAVLVNGPERRPGIRIEKKTGKSKIHDRWLLHLDPYDALLDVKVSAGGTRLDGEWRKRKTADTWRTLPFHADHGSIEPYGAGTHCRDDLLEGRWQVQFAADELPSVGMFTADGDCRITGTFLNATGDYRYLAGGADDTRLQLSTFDGAHAFLFQATLVGPDALEGDFWSADTWHETWTAERNLDAVIPDSFQQTRWTGKIELSDLEFPDVNGIVRNLASPEFRGKVRMIEIMGTWCPNCNDSTRFLTELHDRYSDQGLSIVALAFEATGEFETDATQVRRYMEHHGVEFPMLVAGINDKTKATASLQALDRIRSFPTTIFIGRDGKVRKVHSGFEGPATGKAYERLRQSYQEIILELLRE